MTLSQLKRDIESGRMQAELLFSKPAGNDRMLSRPGKMEKGKGERIILRAQGMVREFLLPRASLIDYRPDDNRLTIYREGYRTLTPEEKEVLQEWKKESAKPDYKWKVDRARHYHSSEAYWHRRSFFEKKSMLHLLGKEEVDGQLLDWDRFKAKNPYCIKDKSVKGDVLYIFSVCAG